MPDKPLVLLLDDEPQVREVFEYVLTLTPLDLRLRTGSSLEEAEAAISEEQPDLVITDTLAMPSHPEEVVRRLRLLIGPVTPILFVSGLATIPGEMPIQGHLRKPFRNEEFQSTVMGLLAGG